MKRKSFLVLFIVPLLSFFALPSLTTASQSKKIYNTKLNSVKQVGDRTIVEYGDYNGGYFDTTTSPVGFPTTQFYLDEGKYAYHDNNGGYLSPEDNVVFDCENGTMTFSMPFIIPGLEREGAYSNHIIRYSDGIVEDLWENVNKVGNDGSGQPNFSTFEVKGKPIEDISEEYIPITDKFEFKGCLMNSPDGTRHSVDGATFGFKDGVNESFYDYTYISIELTDCSYTSKFANNESYEGWNLREVINDDLQANPFDSFEPSNHVHFNYMEEVVDNFPSVPVWYEAAKSSSSHGSFKNKETAINKVSELMLADVNAHREAHLADYTGQTFSERNTFEFGSDRTYTDYTGMNSSSFSSIEPYDVHDFKHGSIYDIDIVPSYETITEDPHFRHKVEKVCAFKHNDPKINDFIKTQATKFVEERNIIDHHRPIEPFLDDENENVIFKDYQFYKSTSEDEEVSPPQAYVYENDATYSYIGTFDSEMTTGHMIDEPDWPGFLLFENHNGFYSFQYGFRKWTEPYTKDLVLAHTNTAAEWQTVAQASGDPAFVNLYNKLYVGETEDEYIINEDYDNKITFKSADGLFIRVTKDDAAPEYHTAYATYSSDGVNPATLTKKQDYVLDMNEPGTYKIEFMNRTDTEPVSLTMHLLGDEGFGLTGSGNNSSLNLSIVNGSSKNLKQLTIQRSKTYSSHLENQTYVETLDGPVDPTVLKEQGFGDPLEYDESDTPKQIVPTTQNYEFKEIGATRDNPFNECFYVKAELLNSTKYFYLFWNYEIPEYAVTVNVIGEGTYSGSTTYKEGETTSITLTPNPGYKITEVSWNGTPYAATDIYPQGMTIEEEVNEASTLNVTFSGVTYYTFTATYDNTQGTVSCKDKYDEFETAHIEVTPNEEYLIESIRWNGEPVTGFDPSHYVIEEVLTKNTTMVVTFKAMEHPTTLTIDKNDGGSVSGGGTFEKGTEIEITITPYDGYEIESITLGEQTLEIKTSFKITLENDITLKVRFKKIEHPAGGGNSGMIIGICCGVGALAIGLGTFLIIRAKKVGSMKK